MKKISLFLMILALTMSAFAVFVPALAHQPELDTGYTYQQQGTQNQWVVITDYRVKVTIENHVARTHIEQVFVNEGNRMAEGTYIFPLPHGVTITDLVMVVDGQPFTGKIMEKDEAREIYNEIVRETRDPALLEYIGSNAIQANIFPIPAGGTRTIEINYSQLLTVDNNLVNYVYPLRTNYLTPFPVRQLSIQVDVSGDDPISNIYSSSHNLATHRLDENSFSASFETTNTFESNDFNLYYGVANDDFSLNVITYRESASEDGYFMAMLAPPFEIDEERIIPKNVIIVLDKSGSMDGTKWDQARNAAKFILANLNPHDQFNVVLFDSTVRTYATSLQPIAEASDAQNWLDSNFANGGTNINEALQMALDMNNHDNQMVILFLTDGLPTEGVVDIPSILGNFEAETDSNVRVFSFGVGDDVNTVLLDELSQKQSGTSTYVRPGEAIDEKVSALYSKVSAPVLTDLALEFDGVDVYDVYPSLENLPDLFYGSSISITGRYHRESDDVTLRLTGQIDNETHHYEYVTSKFRSNAGGDSLIARLWATRRIGDMLTTIRLNGEDPELVESIIRLSIRYGIITPYTSFLITEEDILTHADVDRLSAGMQPTVMALSNVNTGANAVNAAQNSGDMSNSGIAATLPPSQLFAMPTASAPANWSVTATPLATFPAGTPGAMNSPAPPSATPPPAAGGLQTVAGHTFILRDGVWIDTLYNPDEMETIEIEFLSEDYFDLLLSDDERFAAFMAIGDEVIFVIDGDVYEIVVTDNP